MKNTSLALMLVGLVGTASAQEKGVWVALQGGVNVPVTKKGSGNSVYKDAPLGGLGAGVWLNNRWGAEFFGLASQHELRTNGEKGYEHHTGLSALFNFNPGKGPVYPYVRAGLGVTFMGKELDLEGGSRKREWANYHAGIGVQGFTQDHIWSFMELRGVRIGTRDNHHTEAHGLIGVGYRWGGRRLTASLPLLPEPEPAPRILPPPPPIETPQPVEVPKLVEPPPPVEPPKPIEMSKPVPVVPKKIVLDEAVLHFGNGKANLSKEGTEAIEKVAAELKELQTSYMVEVSGHTSSVGSKALNTKLSRQRAEAVAKVLVNAGIPAATVKAIGIGPDQPLADNKTRDGQAKNRRVEIVIKTSDSQVEMRKMTIENHESSAKPVKSKKASKKAAPAKQ